MITNGQQVTNGSAPEAEDYLEAELINPPHRAKAEKVTRLAADMKMRGWVGRPILAHADGNGRPWAWTGSHRIAAAREVGIVVPVVYITGDIERRCEECCDDRDRLAVLEDAGDEVAAELMREEIRATDTMPAWCRERTV